MGSSLDLVIVGIYMIVLVAIGMVFGKLVKSGSDYFKAGAKGSWWMVGASMFMSGISAWTFVGNASGVFRAGWSLLAIYLANVLGFILAAFFLAAWYRQMRVITYAETIHERFGKSAEQIVAHLLVLNGFMWAGVGLYTLCVFVTPLIPGVPIEGLILGIGFVVVLYCTVGGNWAVMANDFVQGIILIIVTTIVTVLCFVNAGGIGAFFDAVANSSAAQELQMITPLPLDAPAGASLWGKYANYGLAWCIVIFINQLFNQSSLFQGVRYFSAKDGREARKASIFAGILMTFGLIVFFVPPIYARVFLESEVLAMHEVPKKAAEFAYSIASQKVLPNGTFSIMIVAIFAAAISTLDTGLNRNAALIIRDLLPAHRKVWRLKPINPAHEVKLGKLTTVLAGFVVMGVAIFYANVKNTSLFDFMLKTIIGQLMTPQFVPLILFLFIRKVPRWAIFSSLIGGYLPSVVLLILNVVGEPVVLSSHLTMALVMGCGTIGYLLAIPFWSKTSAEEKEATRVFYEKMGKPIDFEKEVGEGNDSFQLIMIGRFALVLGLMFLLLLFPVDSAAGRYVVLTISGVVGGVGLMMYLSGKRIERKSEG